MYGIHPQVPHMLNSTALSPLCLQREGVKKGLQWEKVILGPEDALEIGLLWTHRNAGEFTDHFLPVKRFATFPTLSQGIGDLSVFSGETKQCCDF